MMKFFILRDEERRNNAIEFLKKINLSRPYSVEIKQYRKNRSNSQNRLMWSWYNVLASDTGYTPEELHEEFKVRLLGVERKTIAGVEIIEPKSTAKLKTEEFTDFLGGIEMAAHEMGIHLPHPDDYHYAMTGKEAMRA